MGRLLTQTIKATCAAVYDRAVVNPGLRGMGSG